MLVLIEEMFRQGHTYIACPEYIPFIWIPIFMLLFTIVFICKTIIDKLWQSLK